MKPKLRIDAYYDIQSALVEALTKTSMQNPIYQSCINCDNFNEPLELCKLANQRPPARVICFGCKSWSDKDMIPF